MSMNNITSMAVHIKFCVCMCVCSLHYIIIMAMSLGFISLQRYHRQDMALALLVAARRHDVKIVRHILLQDILVMKEELPAASTSASTDVLPHAEGEGYIEEELLAARTTVFSQAMDEEKKLSATSTTVLSRAMEEGLSVIFEVLDSESKSKSYYSIFNKAALIED